MKVVGELEDKEENVFSIDEYLEVVGVSVFYLKVKSWSLFLAVRLNLVVIFL